jgi:hypothetical protein
LYTFYSNGKSSVFFFWTFSPLKFVSVPFLPTSLTHTLSTQKTSASLWYCRLLLSRLQSCFISCHYLYLVELYQRVSWRCRYEAPPKRLYVSSKLHDIVSRYLCQNLKFH